MHKILITKDAMIKDSLRIYNNNSYFDTPNIKMISDLGVKLDNHYCTAPSTAMSVSSIIYNLFPYQFNRKTYSIVKHSLEPKLFIKAKSLDYEIALFLPDNWVNFINMIGFLDQSNIYFYNSSNNNFNEEIITLINKLKLQKHFIWIHVPHVISPRKSYNSDIDLFDKFIGDLFKSNKLSDIYITSDHGHMNLIKNKIVYGFDLFQSAVNVPFISSVKFVNTLLSSHIDMLDIIFDNAIPNRDYIIIETAYRLQAHRQIAVLNHRYKLIYNKWTKRFSLFDYVFDPSENRDLLIKSKFDLMRGKYYDIESISFYPYNELIDKNYSELMSVFQKIYQSESLVTEFYLKIIFILKKIYLIVNNSIKYLLSKLTRLTQ